MLTTIKPLIEFRPLSIKSINFTSSLACLWRCTLVPNIIYKRLLQMFISLFFGDPFVQLMLCPHRGTTIDLECEYSNRGI